MECKRDIIFVGGIHGVGKTTFCKKIAKNSKLEHFSSSELISMLDYQRIKKDKKVIDIKDNQNILLDAVEYFLDKDKSYLLDGHFCLIDKDNNIKEIPASVYQSLGVKEIIVLSDYESKILERLKARDDRDYSLEFLHKFQEKEISSAKCVAKKIKVPIKVVNLSADDFYDKQLS